MVISSPRVFLNRRSEVRILSGDAIYPIIIGTLGERPNYAPPSLRSGLTVGLTERVATELDLCRHTGSAALPTDVFSRGLTTRLAIACSPANNPVAREEDSPVQLGVVGPKFLRRAARRLPARRS